MFTVFTFLPYKNRNQHSVCLSVFAKIPYFIKVFY